MEQKRAKTPGSGRKKGVPNKSTSEARELLQKVLGKELDKLGLLLAKLEPIERVNALAKLLPYILPKQSEITIGPKEEMTPEQKTQRLKELKEKLLNSDI
ncbi:hypothetical protein [Flavobacterium soyangense]|uniref:Uncharacterized protein n=1 Tax=Flavobacterium soyangense TaxID=2023265 RepID=A0A930XX76_9FLAO|nr:hypothetical protein [Flavobacterium soyangense]MBF2709952.1 hypothetical protein [Flavobacterium soyangense]